MDEEKETRVLVTANKKEEEERANLYIYSFRRIFILT